MASVVVTIKIMPTGVDTDLDKLFTAVETKVRAFVDDKHKTGEVRKEIEPIGFGLKALKVTFVYDENLGGSDKLEEDIRKLTGVESAEAVDVRRAIG